MKKKKKRKDSFFFGLDNVIFLKFLYEVVDVFKSKLICYI